jgi:hypothetical protein
MSTTQVSVERRASQRFDFQLPICVRIPGREAEGHGFTQDLSGRGAFFFTDMNLVEGDAVELTLVMPAEITFGESMRVRCRGRITRVNAIAVGGKYSVAAHFEGYEYLPSLDGSIRDASRAAPSQENHSEDEAGLTVHTFDWRGTAPLAHH